LGLVGLGGFGEPKQHRPVGFQAAGVVLLLSGELSQLEQRLGPEQRLVAMNREWDANAWGMDPQARKDYEILLRVPVGGGDALLIRRRPSPQPKEP